MSGERLTVSGERLLLANAKHKMAPRNVMPSLFLYAPPKKGGVYSVYSLQFVFSPVF
jgi:hypothetical protein